jgi:hypothetical protein
MTPAGAWERSGQPASETLTTRLIVPEAPVAALAKLVVSGGEDRLRGGVGIGNPHPHTTFLPACAMGRSRGHLVR